MATPDGPSVINEAALDALSPARACQVVRKETRAAWNRQVKRLAREERPEARRQISEHLRELDEEYRHAVEAERERAAAEQAELAAARAELAAARERARTQVAVAREAAKARRAEIKQLREQIKASYAQVKEIENEAGDYERQAYRELAVEREVFDTAMTEAIELAAAWRRQTDASAQLAREGRSQEALEALPQLTEWADMYFIAYGGLPPLQAVHAANALYQAVSALMEHVSAFRKMETARLNGVDQIGPRRLAEIYGVSRSYAQQMIEEGRALLAAGGSL